MSSYLIKKETEPLIWSGNFTYPGLIRKRTERDGSCYFHAIIDGFYMPYRTGIIDGRPFNREIFIKRARKDLAIKLSEKNEKGITYYDSISRGELKNLSKNVKEVSLKNMQKELLSDSEVSYIYHELISDLYDLDVYILDYIKKDVRIIDSDLSLYYKNRRSVVILYLPGHFELVGIRRNGILKTLFSPKDDFIIYIRKRMEKLLKDIIKKK